MNESPTMQEILKCVGSAEFGPIVKVILIDRNAKHWWHEVSPGIVVRPQDTLYIQLEIGDTTDAEVIEQEDERNLEMIRGALSDLDLSESELDRLLREDLRRELRTD